MNQAPRKKASSGFSLLEMVIAVVMVGFIAMFTIPNFLISVGNDTYNNKVKAMMQQIQLDVVRYKGNNPVATNVDSDTVAMTSKYVSKVTAGNLITITNAACSATTPCYLYSDNTVVQTDVNTSGDGYVYFNVDPDGSGGIKAVTVMYNYNKDRLTTYPNATSGLLGAITRSVPTGFKYASSNPSYFQ